MVKGKKSFILYSDQRGTFDKLSDEQAGKLIKYVFSYVNDEDPESDFITELAFVAIKSQLKRDLEHWEVVKAKRSDAGKASAEARAIKKEQETTKPTSVESVQQTSTNPTVNVNGNVIVNDILLEKETKGLLQIWLHYRKEIKKPIKSTTTIEAISKKIKLNGFEKSKKIIDYSIENGYQGLFWNKEETPKKKTNSMYVPPKDFKPSDQSLVKAEHDKAIKELGL